TRSVYSWTSSSRSNAPGARSLAGEAFDLIVVGGGAYGIMLALESVRRGLRPLVVERGDFAGATSHNSLRVVHGGLRYLQGLDLPRFRESVAERRWFLRHFPDLVEPLPCLMPLYGEGARRPAVLRAALLLNDALSHRRNVGVPAARALPQGRVLDAAATRGRFPGVARAGLAGAALWHDAFIPDAPRLLIEALRWARAHGAHALNYVEGGQPIVENGRVTGLRAHDLRGGDEVRFRAPLVVNATGPWAPAFAAECGAPAPELCRPSLAWNVVFDRPPPADCALAARARGKGVQTYFLVPWKGVLLAGTGHASWDGGVDAPRLSAPQLAAFIADLNAAVPGLCLGESDVARVFAGILPATRAGGTDLTVREAIVDHGARGGPSGLISLCGIKLTTARRVADKVLRQAFPAARPVPYNELPRLARTEPEPDYPFRWMPGAGDNAWRGPLARAVAEDAVEHLDDLILRRSALGDNPARARRLAEAAAALFAWDGARRGREIAALEAALKGAAAPKELPGEPPKEPPKEPPGEPTEGLNLNDRLLSPTDRCQSGGRNGSCNRGENP
ncbi:MAG: FAD-dependent oxidoreductase, partial [Kiloniellaceae bacterium]